MGKWSVVQVVRNLSFLFKSKNIVLVLVALFMIEMWHIITHFHVICRDSSLRVIFSTFSGLQH